MEDILKQILSEMKEMKSDILHIKNKVNSIDDKIDSIEANNAKRHTEIELKLNELNESVQDMQSDINTLGVKTFKNENKLLQIDKYFRSTSENTK